MRAGLETGVIVLPIPAFQNRRWLSRAAHAMPLAALTTNHLTRHSGRFSFGRFLPSPLPRLPCLRLLLPNARCKDCMLRLCLAQLIPCKPMTLGKLSSSPVKAPRREMLPPVPAIRTRSAPWRPPFFTKSVPRQLDPQLPISRRPFWLRSIPALLRSPISSVRDSSKSRTECRRFPQRLTPRSPL